MAVYVVLLGLDMLTIARTQHDVEAKAVSKFSVLLACQELGWLFSKLCTLPGTVHTIGDL